MSLSITIPENYGYAALIALGVIPFLSFVHGSVAGRYRRAAKVPYPSHYATAEQAKSDRAAYQFNCAQRAHGNLLENMTQTIAMLLFSALFYPKAAAVTGAVWTVSRILFLYGYVSSDVNGKGRMIGSPFWLCQAGLWGMCISGALSLI